MSTAPLALEPPAYAGLPSALHARAAITPLANLELVACSAQLARALGLDSSGDALRRAVNGEGPLPAGAPLSQAYAGHSFGHYHPQLGDGRACMLGELRDRDGQRWELQVKGSGPTPFARGLSGRLVLSAALLEYLISEFLATVGVPATRTLAVYAASDRVYEVHGQALAFEPGALLVRAAPSHVRFGTFELLYHRAQHEHVRALADHVIERGYPQLAGRRERYAELFEAITARTARMIAAWDALGFVHGMMNTDNLSVLGLTLDLGPCGFIDDYDPAYCPNTGDPTRRYRFDNQMRIGAWSLGCLAQALLPVLELPRAREIWSGYEAVYERELLERMSNKLGVSGPEPRRRELLQALRTLLCDTSVDYTLFFALLESGGWPQLERAFPQLAGARGRAFHDALRALAPAPRRAPNPRVIPRGHLLQAVVNGAKAGDLVPFRALAAQLSDPFSGFTSARPEPAERNLARAY